jgi:hypothetical protein
MPQSLILELVRQAMRWLGLALVNVPWLADLTGREDFIIWVAGLASYVLADTAWIKSFWRRWKEWRA